MRLLHRLASVVRWISRRNKAEAELRSELEAFVDMAAADHVRDGATPDEARRLAALQLGGFEQVKERVRAGRHGGGLDAAIAHLSAGLFLCSIRRQCLPIQYRDGHGDGYLQRHTNRHAHGRDEWYLPEGDHPHLAGHRRLREQIASLHSADHILLPGEPDH